MYHLIYTSHATKSFEEEDILELLKQSRTNNKLMNISGMLLFLKGKFIQVLEGEKQQVEILYQRISHDSRHRKVTMVVEGDSPARIFKDWSMGFKKVNDSEFLSEGAWHDIDIFFKEQQTHKNRNLIFIFLQLFYQKNNVDYPEPINK